MAKKRRQSSKLSKPEGTYVLFGFCRADPEDVGYLARIPQTDEDEGIIASELAQAMRFPESKIESARKFINQEFIDIYGPFAYAFHKIKVLK